MKKILLVVLALFTLSSCTKIMGLMQLFFKKKKMPKEERVSTSVISGRGKVFTDQHGIPHIYAQTLNDAIYMSGYIQGRERFFQLDLMRRIAQGRLSELIGKQEVIGIDSLMFDLTMRGWGMKERSVIDKKSPYYLHFKNFSDGVNEGLRKHPPIEYRLLNVKPEPWTPNDVISVGLLQAWSITHNWQQELIRFFLAYQLDFDLSSKVFSHEPLKGEGSLPNGNYRKLPVVAPVDVTPLFKTHHYKDPVPQENKVSMAEATNLLQVLASNSWVISDRYTQEKDTTILSNDIHLAHTLPSVFFLQHINVAQEKIDVMGGSVVGLPMIVAGHNHHVAWGMTSSVADVVDLVILERDEQGRIITGDQGLCPIEEKKEVIKERKKKEYITHEYTIRHTCFGPVLNDFYPHLFTKKMPLLALKWLLPNIEESIHHYFEGAKSKNVKELHQALGKLISPSVNITAGDRSGTLASFTIGKVPKRNHRGTFPVSSRFMNSFKTKFYNGGELPHLISDQKNFFVNANNLAKNPYYSETFFQVDSAPYYRRDRIQEMILAHKKHTVESVTNMQKDVVIKRAEKFLPVLLQQIANNDQFKKYYDLLKAWRYTAEVESIAPTLFYTWYQQIAHLVLKEKLRPEQLKFFLSHRYAPTIIDQWLEEKENPIWDDFSTPNKEVFAAQVQQAFKNTLKLLSENLGKEKKWKWGHIHKTHFHHPFGSKKIVAGKMNLKAKPLAGGIETVWKTQFNLQYKPKDFYAVSGPAYRAIMKISPEGITGGWSIDTGISGHPKNRHYGDHYKAWLKGELFPMYLNEKELAGDNTSSTTIFTKE